MARRVGLPPPSLTPFGGGGRSFSQYDVLDDGSRDDGREFQKQQALWAAGKITDGAYLAAYQKYVNGLEKGSSQRINAQQSLDKERYTMGRNDIVARIDAGDESAWNALLAYDQQSLSGMQTDNEEYQRRLSYLRSTQNSIFQTRYADMSAKVQAGQMTNQQLYSWLRGQQRSGLTSGNGALAQQIDSAADAMGQTIANERREKVYSQYQDGRMSPAEFINYARTQKNTFKKGTPQHAQWVGRMRGAKLARQEANMSYRWQLSQQYHENQQALQAPDPSDGAAKTRQIYSAGDWRDEPLDYVPTANEVASYEDWQKKQILLKQEQTRIERQLGRVDLDFVDPDGMLKFYRERQKGVVKGSQEWLALQSQINQFRDTKASWEMFKPENGFFPSPAERAMPSGKGKRLPTEGQINVRTFMRALGGQYGGAKQQAGADAVNRYGISPSEWRAWAKEYLGDSSAKQTPDNLDLVVESRLNDLHDRYGSWAMVGYAWTNGADADTIGQWDPASKQVVDSMWQGMGLGPLPTQWSFNLPQVPSGSRGLDPTIAGPAAAGQEYLGAGVASEPQLYAISGPVGPNGVPQTTKTKGLEGMTPGEFDSIYSAARRAFLDGQTSFYINGINYYFPAELSTRADTMGDMDKVRTDLLYGNYVEAQAVVDTMAGQASQEQIDAADDARQKHAQAFDVMNQNAIDMMFMKQKAGYDPVTGEDTGGKTNYNPGADYQRIEEMTEIGIQQHLDKAAEWFALGHETQAIVELQTANDMAAKARAHMEVVDAQVQQLTKQVQAVGTDPTESQSADIKDVASWEDKWGVKGEIAQQIQTQRSEVLEWVATDAQGNIMWSDDGENVLPLPGTAKILVHPEDGSGDTVTRIFMKTHPRPGASFGSLAPTPFLENHLHGAATIGGDTVPMWLPYSEDVVGNVITDDGQIVPVKGKIMWTDVNGLHQTVIENPFKPGTFQVRDGFTDQPEGFTWKAPEGFSSEQDDYGNQRLSLERDGSLYTLEWDSKNSAYNLFEQSQQRQGFMGVDGLPDPQFLGNLADNDRLADEMVAPFFQRDMSDVPKYAMASQDMLGALVGQSAEQFGATQKVEAAAQQKLRADAALTPSNMARLGPKAPAPMPVPGTPISDEMRSVSSALSQPIQRQPPVNSSLSAQQMSQPNAPVPEIDGTPISVDFSNSAWGGTWPPAAGAMTYPDPKPAPSVPKPTPTPPKAPKKPPSYNNGPLIL